MTVSTTQNRVSYAGNGVTSAFSFPYVFFDSADLAVLLVQADGTFTRKVLGTDYTITGAGAEAGGTVTMTTAPAAGTTLVVYRDPALTQPQAFVDNDPLPAKSVSRGYDRLTVITQRIRELVDRSFRLSDADTSGASPVLPTPTPNAFIGWDGAATSLVNRTLVDLITISAYGTAVSDKFTGDGVKVDFTLSANPGALANLDVSIAGITQMSGRDFIWDGATKLTFLSAPPAPTVGGDTNIYVRYLRGLPLGYADASLVNYTAAFGNIGVRTVQDKLREFRVTPQDFAAKGDGVKDDTAAFASMFALGVPWYIPKGVYKITGPLTIKSSGMCDGQLVVAAGFAGVAVQIVNAAYGQKLHIFGLDVYSTDVRPSPYTAAKTTGILVGPNATYSGNTPCPGVTLYSCKAQRFSVDLHIATFNVSVIGGVYNQGDHNVLVYSYDTTYNQVNDVSLFDVQMDSPQAAPGKIAYSLRVGTTGDGSYAGSPGNGVNLRVQGCNFDGGAVYIDNIYGVDFRGNYQEQASVYTYTGASLVLGAAGPGYLRNVYVGYCWFTNFDYGIDVPDTVPGLTIDPNNYATIKYAPVRIAKCETQTFKYRSGQALGSTITGGGRSDVQTNYSSGIGITQLTFSAFQIEGDWLVNGVQMAPNQAATTNWYPNGSTLDGWKNVASAYGRFRSGSAVQTGIAGTQSGKTFTFTTPADALKFNGGDRISSSAGGAAFVMSVDYSNGTAILDSTYTGATTISHNAAVFLGVLLYGTGSPNGVVTATSGSTYVNLTGGDTNTLWTKTGGGNTGWVAK